MFLLGLVKQHYKLTILIFLKVSFLKVLLITRKLQKFLQICLHFLFLGPKQGGEIPHPLPHPVPTLKR